MMWAVRVLQGSTEEDSQVVLTGREEIAGPSKRLSELLGQALKVRKTPYAYLIPVKRRSPAQHGQEHREAHSYDRNRPPRSMRDDSDHHEYQYGNIGSAREAFPIQLARAQARTSSG
jgi:hypothetical protein